MPKIENEYRVHEKKGKKNGEKLIRFAKLRKVNSDEGKKK